MDRQCPSCGGFCKKSGCERENTKPKRDSSSWVGLTNEDIDDLWKTEYFNISYELPRAIEAKLKEKNT